VSISILNSATEIASADQSQPRNDTSVIMNTFTYVTASPSLLSLRALIFIVIASEAWQSLDWEARINLATTSTQCVGAGLVPAHFLAHIAVTRSSVIKLSN